MRNRARRAYSMAELLVVIAILMILSSLIVTGTGEVYEQAVALKCQQNLCQIWQATMLWMQKHDNKWANSYDNPFGNENQLVKKQRWYKLLDKIIKDARTLECPSDDGHVHMSEFDERSTLPVLTYAVGEKRGGTCWTKWMNFMEFRDWMTMDPEDRVPSEPTYVRFRAEYNAGDVPLKITEDVLAGFSQLWMLSTWHVSPFQPEELAAMKSFNESRGGVQLFTSGSYPSASETMAQAISGVAEPIHNGIAAGHYNSPVVYKDSTHPVMVDVHEMGRGMTYRAGAMVTPEPFTEIGVTANGEPAIVGYDEPGRLLIQHSLHSLDSYAEGTRTLRWNNPDYDAKQYALNSAEWLFAADKEEESGTTSYGYNNQVGVEGKKQQTVAGDTIIVMDYHDWEINRNLFWGLDANNMVAARHGGEANAVLADGSAVSIAPEDLTEAMFTPEAD
jgi:type II secretory pathway pseudopilin PulG